MVFLDSLYPVATVAARLSYIPLFTVDEQGVNMAGALASAEFLWY